MNDTTLYHTRHCTSCPTLIPSTAVLLTFLSSFTHPFLPVFFLVFPSLFPLLAFFLILFPVLFLRLFPVFFPPSFCSFPPTLYFSCPAFSPVYSHFPVVPFRPLSFASYLPSLPLILFRDPTFLTFFLSHFSAFSPLSASSHSLSSFDDFHLLVSVFFFLPFLCHTPPYFSFPFPLRRLPHFLP